MPMDADPMSECRLTLARVTPKTVWAFLEARWSSGLEGSAEATLPSREDGLVEAFLSLEASSFGMARREARSSDPLAVAAVFDAVAFARADAEARAAGKPLGDHLGGGDAPVPVYANINRRTTDRSPEGFAASARHALAKGFRAFKIAPFDEVNVTACATGDGERLMQAGLARIAAVRGAIGNANDLMVDCHWRFDAATADRLVEAVRPFSLHWLECPVPETDEFIPVLGRLRSSLNASGARLAGLEEFVGVDSFLRFAEVYDVMMPDVKYVGGPQTLRRLSEELARRKIEVAPHNPTGPLCHAVSAHAAGMIAGFTRLEMQIDETPLFDALVRRPCPAPADGMLARPPGHGHGMALARETLDALAVRTEIRRF